MSAGCKSFYTIFTSLCFIILQGCSVKIDGEIFVVTKSGASTKLGLATVYAMPAAAMRDFASNSLAKHTALRKELDSAVEKISFETEYRELSQLRADVKTMKEKYTKCKPFFYVPTDCKTNVPKEISESHTARLAATEAKLLPKVEATLKAMEFAENLPLKKFLRSEVAIAMAKASKDTLKTQSDSNGNFSITLPNRNYVLVAESGRQVVDEEYLWIVNIKGEEGKILLANNTMFDQGCSQCIISQNDLSEMSKDARRISMYGERNAHREWFKLYAQKRDYGSSFFGYAKKLGLITSEVE